jgi:hypothetical protein
VTQVNYPQALEIKELGKWEEIKMSPFYVEGDKVDSPKGQRLAIIVT